MTNLEMRKTSPSPYVTVGVYISEQETIEVEVHTDVPHNPIIVKLGQNWPGCGPVLYMSEFQASVLADKLMQMTQEYRRILAEKANTENTRPMADPSQA